MAKNIEFEVINNCNRDIIVKIGSKSSSIRQGAKAKLIGPEGDAVGVIPHNASFDRTVGHITGATIVVSGYNK